MRRRLARLACRLGVHDIRFKDTPIRTPAGRLHVLWVGCVRGCGLELSWESIWYPAKWLACGACRTWHPSIDTLNGAPLVECPAAPAGQLYFVNARYWR